MPSKLTINTTCASSCGMWKIFFRLIQKIIKGFYKKHFSLSRKKSKCLPKDRNKNKSYNLRCGFFRYLCLIRCLHPWKSIWRALICKIFSSLNIPSFEFVQYHFTFKKKKKKTWGNFRNRLLLKLCILRLKYFDFKICGLDLELKMIVYTVCCRKLPLLMIWAIFEQQDEWLWRIVIFP